MTSNSADSLVYIDLTLESIFQLVTRLCHEAHMDDEDIAEIIATSKTDTLEIISDTADEVLAKVQHIVVEARLWIAERKVAR